MKVGLMTRTTLQSTLLYVLAYLLWLVNIVVCIVAVIEFRSAINVLWAMSGQSRYSLGLVNQLSLLIGGFAAFVYVVFLESFYRKSVMHRDQRPEHVKDLSTQEQASPQSRIAQWLTRSGFLVLLKRFAITIAIPLGLLVVSLVMTEVAWRGLH
jgi:hypothetical protein